MRSERRSSSIRQAPAILLVALTAGLSGCGAGSQAATTSAPTAGTGSTAERSTTETSTTDASAAEAGGTTTTTGSQDQGGQPIIYPTGIVPTSVEIPSLDLRADTIELGLAGAQPEVPSDFDDTGWYRQTRLPGEIGPAVIAGHIDSVTGPAVFARIDELEAGDEIVVRSSSGEHRTFIVQRTGQYPKTELPDEVFGFDLPVPELRLITCGGTFDRASGHYRDNFVVYATLAEDADTSG